MALSQQGPDMTRYLRCRAKHHDVLIQVIVSVASDEVVRQLQLLSQAAHVHRVTAWNSIVCADAVCICGATLQEAEIALSLACRKALV